MRREDLEELHFITPITNVRSILTRGILSHELARNTDHTSVALQQVQDKRARVTIPGGRRLHEYANLYICARNPMLYLRSSQHLALCVLRISTGILDFPGVIIADQNASSNYVRFGASPTALTLIDRDKVFAEYWTHPGDQIEEWRHKSAKCAEVLVPDRVLPQYIVGAYVSCKTSEQTLIEAAPSLPVTVNAHLFFQ